MYIYRMASIASKALILNLLFMTTSFCNHKIVYFISPPRSLSVAFLRMMQARGDFAIMHEPSQLVFNLANSPDLVQSWYRQGALRSYAQVKQSILQEAQTHNVFVKEMSFAVRDFHLNDFELMKNPDVYFVFLVRNPHHTTISMYKKIAHVFDSVSHQMPYLIGYKDACDIFKVAQSNALNEPYVMSTEDLYNNPEETIKKFCEHVGIDFKPESLHWEDLGTDFDGLKDWHEAKYKELTNHWHGDAIRSTGFGKPHDYELDNSGMPTFSEIINDQHRDICKAVYLEHKHYYDLLMESKN